MKKNIKILAIVIVLIIAIASVYSFLKGKKYVQGASLYFEGGSTDNLIISVSEEQMKSEYKNIYNVTYSQQSILKDWATDFEATAMAQIRGEDVTFTNYYSGSTDYTTKNITTSKGKTCLENNIMAAIISGAGVKNIGFKYLDESGEYSSGAQLAIWEFWNTWVENSGAKENGFEKGSGNGTITENELNGEEERKNAQEFATQNIYNVNIYFLKYLTHNNLTISEEIGIDIDNQPNLILIEILDEEGNIIEPEEVEENSDISLLVTDNIESIVKVGEEISYNIEVYNKSKEEKQNLILSNTLPEGSTLIKVVEIVDYNEVELEENKDYNYNGQTRLLTVNLNKIDAQTEGVITDESTGEQMSYTKMGRRNYKVIVRVDELEEGIYSKEIKNVVKVQKENSILAREESINTVSGDYLEIEVEKLPEKINEKQECVIGLKITNKGLLTAENVNVKISIPEEILMKSYKIIILSETGEEERVVEGTTSNEFENNSIEIPSQKTVYIQLIGSINEIEETKEITIEGTVDEEKAYWTTKAQKEGGC